MSNRELEQSEAEDLLKTLKREFPDVNELWPGERNLELIAHAVNLKRDSVQLRPNAEAFTITYYNNIKAVFVKPAAETFVPCGWFTYKELKGVLGH